MHLLISFFKVDCVYFLWYAQAAKIVVIGTASISPILPVNVVIISSTINSLLRIAQSG